LLADLGQPSIGIAASREMLRLAASSGGGLLLRADVEALPIADRLHGSRAAGGRAGLVAGQDGDMGGARYDEHAAWYDRWSQAEQHPEDCVVCLAIADLDDGRAGVLADIGCGGVAHRQALLRSGRSLAGPEKPVPGKEDRTSF